ncbi:MAG: (Fe-S)-binding protein [Bacteroidota bacterium]|nr:(Fe-S)-binding protein [Candidatus Kapabacteria bacterium]MDW8221221.1 (Fe-S)-binding protein [Bacteroidota bacterium]
MGVKNIVFLLVMCIAFGGIAYNVRRLISYLRLAKSENRLDNIPARVKMLLTVGFGQTKILRDKIAGPIHAGVFWGFLVLLASAVEGIAEGLHEGWSLNFLGPLYSVITVLIDVFCALIMVLTLAALWRRYVSKVPRLQVEGEKLEAGMILITIFCIVTSILFQNASRIAMGSDFSWAVRPAASSIAQVIPAAFADISMEIFFWSHMLLVFGFMNYLPYSKHLHVLTSLPNTFFGNLNYPNSLKPIDFEEEGVEKFGATDIEDFTWKTLLDGYTCTHCGRCTSVCPANQTGKILDPRAIIVAIHDRTMDKAPLMLKFRAFAEKTSIPEEKESALLLAKGKKPDDAGSAGQVVFEKVLSQEEQAIWHRALIGDYIPVEALWQCTTCGACQMECPVMIEHVPAIVEMRRSLVLMEANFPSEVQPAFGNMENSFTPWAFSPSERADWTEGTAVRTVADDSDMDVLFWVGCAGSYDDRAKKVSRAFAELMDIAGVKYRILGTEEKCTGDPARRAGNEYLADMLVRMNIETLSTYNVQKIVTTCPHCMNTLKNDYPQFGGVYEVVHHTQFIRDLVAAGKLRINGSNASPLAVAYHDSCYLGRYNQEYDAPRAVLTNVPGLEVINPLRSKDRGFCCGAGGARMFMEEHDGKRVNIERTEELLATGAQTIAVNCPFCMTMINDGVKSKDKVDDVNVRDVAEILLDAVKNGNA